VFIEAKDDGGGGDNWTTGAISRAKLHSNHHHQQTNTQFLQAGCPSCRPTNSVRTLKGKQLTNVYENKISLAGVIKHQNQYILVMINYHPFLV